MDSKKKKSRRQRGGGSVVRRGAGDDGGGGSRPSSLARPKEEEMVEVKREEGSEFVPPVPPMFMPRLVDIVYSEKYMRRRELVDEFKEGSIQTDWLQGCVNRSVENWQDILPGVVPSDVVGTIVPSTARTNGDLLGDGKAVVIVELADMDSPKSLLSQLASSESSALESKEKVAVLVDHCLSMERRMAAFREEMRAEIRVEMFAEMQEMHVQIQEMRAKRHEMCWMMQGMHAKHQAEIEEMSEQMQTLVQEVEHMKNIAGSVSTSEAILRFRDSLQQAYQKIAALGLDDCFGDELQRANEKIAALGLNECFGDELQHANEKIAALGLH